jgi:DNA-binding beta-propeller fold protein YncE
MYAYITNAGDDTVYYIDTQTNTLVNLYDENQCTSIPVPVHYPTSIDVRNDGSTGYIADYESRDSNEKSIISVFNLANPTNKPTPCNIEVGTAPIRIVVQPVPGYETFFAMVRNELAFAQPTDFTTPSKQSNLIRDWEDVNQLQETGANPQAVLANIAAFQTKVGSWVVNAVLKKELNEGINLYRFAYIHDHPGQ